MSATDSNQLPTEPLQQDWTKTSRIKLDGNNGAGNTRRQLELDGNS
uniref:Uncharacterized protein n=1 Tax=Picea glauca TaxID=3330 RepID=A0A101LUN6_PICGL|nr:hypothetical protein ABT39_MTgene2523 [Picea glauca]